MLEYQLERPGERIFTILEYMEYLEIQSLAFKLWTMSFRIQVLDLLKVFFLKGWELELNIWQHVYMEDT